MTRSLKLNFDGGRPTFDFSDRSRDFNCTVQRCMVHMGTAEGSDPVNPEGTQLPNTPGAAVFSRAETVRTNVVTARNSVKKFAAATTTPYKYEGLQDVELTPTVPASGRLAVVAKFTSAEGIVIGQTT